MISIHHRWWLGNPLCRNQLKGGERMSMDLIGVMIKSRMNMCRISNNKNGFTVFNSHDIKWAQIDLNRNKVRIVLDFPENNYNEDQISEMIDIPVISSGNKDAWLFVKTAKQYNADYDAVEITIKSGFLERYLESSVTKLLNFIDGVTDLSHFKLAPSKGLKNRAL
jgi:hypothetical protein